MSNIDQAFINAYADQRSVPDEAKKPPVYGIRGSQSAEGSTVRLFAQDSTDGSNTLRFDPPDQVTHRASASVKERQEMHSAVAAAQRATFSSAAEQSKEAIVLPPLGNQRRPLSAFAAPPQPVQTVFSPEFEVDGFQWPAITDQLVFTAKQLLAPVVGSLLANAEEGRALVGLVGTQAGVGCSTVTMCLARLITETGSSLALVDANFAQGDLAAKLGLEFEHGWEHVLTGNIPLAECAVHSLSDGMTLIPLSAPVDCCDERLASIQTAVIAGVLRYHHDVVLLDLGAPQTPQEYAALERIVEHCRLDTTILIAPSGAGDTKTARSIDCMRQLLGNTCQGVIGNRSA